KLNFQCSRRRSPEESHPDISRSGCRPAAPGLVFCRLFALRRISREKLVLVGPSPLAGRLPSNTERRPDLRESYGRFRLHTHDLMPSLF
ncbi:uncharacterized protein BO80DRAFT_360984, partial [Aspergillus ibericus CBS 121593]